MTARSDMRWTVPLERWGLEADRSAVLQCGGCDTTVLARDHGTPLHVVDESRLATSARALLTAFRTEYPAMVHAHFAFKCNPVAGVLQIVREAGLEAEVGTEFELRLALRLGHHARDIVVNGPFKPLALLELCLDQGVRFIVVDAVQELKTLHELCVTRDRTVDVLLRVNPDVLPRGMNPGSATASRKGSVFGLDPQAGEVDEALRMVKQSDRLQFRGFHVHIGTGIQHVNDYARALRRLANVLDAATRHGQEVSVLDIGGGLASPTSREMTGLELLRYQATGRPPAWRSSVVGPTFQAWAGVVARAVGDLFRGRPLPELLVEPGRCIAAGAQMLLLTVHRVKRRRGRPSWVVTDGGISTVSMPTFYECHPIVLCNDVRRARSERATVTGPACFAADIVYRNLRLPDVDEGEVLAILDSGAYFTSWESSFGFPRPAVIGVRDGRARQLRPRETYQEMMARDRF